MSATVEVPITKLERWERYIERNVYCARQHREGWYAKDCVELKLRRKCEPCRIRTEMLFRG